MTCVASLIETEYGRMIVPTHDFNQTQALVKTKRGVHHDLAMELAAIIAARPAGQVFIDAGANLGAFTMAIAPSVTPDGWIHAFEAQPVICNMLAGSVALTQRTNIRVHNVCLGEFYGNIEVPQFDYRSGLNFGSIEFGTTVQHETLNQERVNDPKRLEYVDMKPLDYYDFQRVDLIKMDVQRMEMAVLFGATATLGRCKPTMLIEHIGNDKHDLMNLIEALGYKSVKDTGDDFLCVPVS